jgi:hypothetical protein
MSFYIIDFPHYQTDSFFLFCSSESHHNQTKNNVSIGVSSCWVNFQCVYTVQRFLSLFVYLRWFD